MTLKIINFPHPTLRHASRPVRRVDAELKATIRRMFELMYEANGIGLAANQVDIPLRFFICNLAANPDEGEELVFLNPVLNRPKGSVEREEGCLSLPGLYAPVVRPDKIHLEAYRLDGEQVQIELDGMLSRVVQHEVDHLEGVLFTDRLSATNEMNVQPALEEFQLEFESRRRSGEIPDQETIATEWERIEQRYG